MTASASPSAARPVTGRGGLGVGVGCSSSVTSFELVMACYLRDRPDRDGRRIATESRTEVVLRQLVERAVVDHRLDGLVERVLVGRALGVDRAVLLTGLVLTDDLELVARGLRLGEDDRGVEEVRVHLTGEQALVEGLG